MRHFNLKNSSEENFINNFFFSPKISMVIKKVGGAKKATKPVRTGDKKRKKQTLKFVIECKNPVEDGIMKTSTFVRRHTHSTKLELFV